MDKAASILLLVVLLSFPYCYGNDTTKNYNQKPKLFSLLTPSQTGISFTNNVTDSREANILIYEAFYEGGGVAIGDINNDGLQDIYFAGNQVEDRLYLNEGGMKFRDITKEAGILSKGGWSTGINMVDINQDGLLDIYVSKSLYDDRPDLRTNELYINNGDLTFIESAEHYGINDPWRSIHANFFDYDRDGDFDMFIIDQPPNPSILSPLENQNYLSPELTYRFLENDNGQFKDITKQSGQTNVGFGLSAVSSDFNNDGWIDLYVANDYEGPDFLYINNSDGTFTNKIDDYMQHISFFSMGADAGDINNDGYMDLLVVDMVAEDNYRLKANMGGMNPQQFWDVVELGGHYQYMFNTLQLNNGVAGGKQVFSDIAQLAGVANTDWSWSPLFADFDNDGYKDIFVTNGIKRDVRSTDALKKLDHYIQQEIKSFTEKHPTQGNVSIWDIVSLDTLLNIFPSQKIVNYIYQNLGDLTFEKKMTDWGINQPTFSSGAAYGDLDNDGDLDLVVNNVDEVAYVYMNNAESLRNNYLSVRFTEGNKAVSNFGTRATIYYQGKQQTSEITSARGFFSSSDPIIHFGLGKIKKVDSLVIHWYDGGVSSLKRIKANQALILDRDKMESRESGLLNRTADDFLFEDITEQARMEFTHQENDYDDYEREVLLPHKMSMLGPGIAVGDVNGDGFEDFFIGGSAGKAGKIFYQMPNSTFEASSSETYNGYPYHEDMGANFFDVENDGDLDLYVVSGGNEYHQGLDLYQDRLYINEGTGIFSLSESALPQSRISGSRVISHDFDNDGDVDLFVCGRQVPGKYPEPAESLLLRNEFNESGKVIFTKMTVDGLDNLGMVTDAVWSDFDNDGDKDLLTVGEWMAITVFENNNGTLSLSPYHRHYQNHSKRHRLPFPNYPGHRRSF